MSTNAIIKIEGVEFAAIWKHWDGYPSSTLPWLRAFNEEFNGKRGFDDPEYKFAQLLRDSVFSGEKYKLDDSKATGWGVIPMPLSWDADYVYTLHSDGTVSSTPEE